MVGTTTIRTKEKNRISKLFSGFSEVFMDWSQPSMNSIAELEKEEDHDSLGPDSIDPSIPTETISQKNQELMDRLTNFVEPQNREMQKVITAFMKKHGKISKDELTRNMNMILLDSPDSEWAENASISTIGTFIQNFIYQITILIPSYLSSNQLIPLDMNVLSNTENWTTKWGLTPNDSFQLMTYVVNPYLLLNPFKNDPILTPFLKEIQDRLSAMHTFISHFPLFLPDIPENRKLYLRIFTFCILSVWMTYIDLTENADILQVTVQNVQKQEREKYQEEQEAANLLFVADTEQVDIQIGDKLSVQKRVHELLVAYFIMIKREKDPVEMSYADIMIKMDRSVEREKRSVKDYFKQMDTEERKAEMTMKSLHLGKFQVNQKSLINYGKGETELFGAEDVGEDENLDMTTQYMNLLEEQGITQENPEIVDEDARGIEDEEDDDMFDITENAYEDYDD
jgi:hypothetical protein